MTTQKPINPVIDDGAGDGWRSLHHFERARQRFIQRFPINAGLFECWTLKAGKGRGGYATYGNGVFFDGDIYVHRIAWRLANDMVLIPDGYEIDHMCFVRNCANPLHLRCVPLNQNRWQRPPPPKTHCPRGHPYEGDNLYVNPGTGQRACRECTRAALRRSHAKHRDKRNAERKQRHELERVAS